MMAALAAPAGLWWLAQRALPRMEGTVVVSQINNPVAVKFDSRAVPYIEAGLERDAYIAQGFLTARDRMFQMDMLRRAAAGNLSEVFGPGCLPADKMARTIGFSRLAADELSQLPPAMRSVLDAYARGVNDYLLTNYKSLPLEFYALGYSPKAWDAQDSLAILKYLSYSLDESWQLDDLRQRIFDKVGAPLYNELFAEDWTGEPLASLPSSDNRQTKQLLAQVQTLAEPGYFFGRPQPGWGSNAWSLSGRCSDTGGCLLVCDKHSAFLAPDIWYLCSLSAPGLHSAGASIAGVPGIIIGRNNDIAWGAASLKADVQDLFLEQFSPQFADQYRLPSGWKNVKEITEEIPVRFAKNLLHKVTLTDHGPVLLKNGNTAVVVAWTGNVAQTSAFASIYKLNHAANWQDFQSALQTYPGPPQDFIYADRLGNMGYHAAGYIPVRAAGGQGTKIVPGWLPQGQWQGQVPFAALPQAYNPASNFVVAANQKLVGPKYPWLIGHQWDAPYRAFRLSSVLSGLIKTKHKSGLADMSELELDAYSQLKPLVTDEIHRAIKGLDLIDRIQLSAVDSLDKWDGQLAAGSSAAAIYESFVHTLARRLLEPKLGVTVTDEYLRLWPRWPLLVERYLHQKLPAWLPAEERTYPVFLLTTFSQSLKNLRLAFRTDDQTHWSWQGVHKATFKHIAERGIPWIGFLLQIGPVGVAGDQDALNANNADSAANSAHFASDSGPTLRTLIDMSDASKFYQSTCLGQSGQFFSPYRKDQLQSWLTVDPKPIAFSTAQVDQQMQHKLVLVNR
jgi:penicillin G amidase